VISATGTDGAGPRDHVVQFYRGDEELAAQVSGYLAGGIEGGGVSIAIATAAHRRAFEDRLAASGVDVAAARAHGDYLAVDAEETLRKFMAGDEPDAAGFDRLACSLIEEPAQRGRSVRVYGELVAVLWDAGLMTAAIELEEMWVGLGRRLPFGLWCGYRAEPEAGEYGAADALAEVCRLHGAVVGHAPRLAMPPGSGAKAAELSRDFAGSLDSIGSARRFVVAALEAGGHGIVADDAALVVTELAANAVVHARSAFTVTVRAGVDRVRIGVRDFAALPRSASGQALPAKPLHGLGAVAAMAVRWGVVPAGLGKDVWAELRSAKLA
jgi:DcmR-like sensory protein